MIFQEFHLTPIRLTVLTYFVLILFGTILLMLPMSTIAMEPIRFIDAFFTATSAVCVTGLVVQDTSTYFSGFGQTIIMMLFQLGGLGIMTLYAALPVIFGHQLKLTQRASFGEIFNTDSYQGLKIILVSIIQYTFIIEIIGATFLSLRFYFLWHDWPKAIYHGTFHAISAFCNAGFSLFSNSFNDFNSDIIINLVLMILIILGGLGFVTLQETIRKRSFHLLSSYSKMVLIMTGILIIIPAFFIFHIEYMNAFAGQDMIGKVLSSLFQSVTTRTAGLNTVTTASLHNTTLFLFCIMMFIGAGPGGTAGGVKVSTVGLLFLSMRSIFKGKTDIECYKKRVPEEVVTKSIAIIAVSFCIVTFFVLALLITEQSDFMQVFFEVLSAFGTVGLSLGLTPELSYVGKILVCMIMFIGRIGSLSLVFILSSKMVGSTHRYPMGKFIVG